MSNLKKPALPTPGAAVKRPAKPPVPQRPKTAPPSDPPMELSDDELISIPPPPPSMRGEGEAADFDARPETVSVTEIELVDPHPPALAPLPFLHLGPDMAGSSPNVATFGQTWIVSKRMQWLAAASAAFAIGVGGGYRLWSRSPAIAAPAAPAASAPDLRAFNAATPPPTKEPEVPVAIHPAAAEPAAPAAALEATTVANEMKEARADDPVQPASRVSAPSIVHQAKPATAVTEGAAAALPPVSRNTPAPSAPASQAHSTDPAPIAAAALATEPVARGAPPPPPVAPSMFGTFDLNAEFDRNAAMEALRNASNAALACRGTGTADGGVRVAVTFARTGKVADAHVDGAGSDTPLGDCVVSKFRTLQVPPFRGSSMTVRRTVTF